MKREDIEKAKSNYIKELCEANQLTNSVNIDIACNSFVYGANWRINSIWHDVSEPPKKNNVYLSIFDGRKIKTVFWSDICKWEEFMKIYEFNGWCYLDDLLPNTEE